MNQLLINLFLPVRVINIVNPMIYRFTLLVLFSIHACISYGQKNYYKPKYLAVLDSVQGEAITEQCSRDSPDSVSSLWNITEYDKKMLLNEFKTIQQLTRNNSGAVGKGPKSWKKYGFQIVGFKKGLKKYIYINAFNIRNEEINFRSGSWKERPIKACGGGDWYWGVTYDIEERKFIELHVNVSH